MKEVNEPNEFELFPHDLNHPNYWIYKVENVRVKTLFSKFDVFINGLFISENDYVVEEIKNDFYLNFKKINFPQYDRFGNPYKLDETDEVKINGDLENIK